MAQRRGDLAKQYVSDTIIQTFGECFVCVHDKKIYLNIPDGPGGEIVQLALSMTMPKVQVEASTNALAAGAPTSASTHAPAKAPVTLSDDDKAAVAQLMKNLGIEG